MRRADHSSGRVLTSMVCLRVISKPQQWGGLGPLRLSTQGRSLKLVQLATSVIYCHLHTLNSYSYNWNLYLFLVAFNKHRMVLFPLISFVSSICTHKLTSVTVSLSIHPSSCPSLMARFSRVNIKQINLLRVLVETNFTQTLECLYSGSTYKLKVKFLSSSQYQAF
jgi:hypothetical protein